MLRLLQGNCKAKQSGFRARPIKARFSVRQPAASIPEVARKKQAAVSARGNSQPKRSLGLSGMDILACLSYTNWPGKDRDGIPINYAMKLAAIGGPLSLGCNDPCWQSGQLGNNITAWKSYARTDRLHYVAARRSAHTRLCRRRKTGAKVRTRQH